METLPKDICLIILDYLIHNYDLGSIKNISIANKRLHNIIKENISIDRIVPLYLKKKCRAPLYLADVDIARRLISEYGNKWPVKVIANIYLQYPRMLDSRVQMHDQMLLKMLHRNAIDFHQLVRNYYDAVTKELDLSFTNGKIPLYTYPALFHLSQVVFSSVAFLKGKDLVDCKTPYKKFDPTVLYIPSITDNTRVFLSTDSDYAPSRYQMLSMYVLLKREIPRCDTL